MNNIENKRNFVLSIRFDDDINEVANALKILSEKIALVKNCQGIPIYNNDGIRVGMCGFVEE